MLHEHAQSIVSLLKTHQKILACAESCTGGLISANITDVSGASDVFDRGFVTYSNEAKQDHLGVESETLAQLGAVSAQTAKEMAKGALKASQADIAISVTGIAGPSGGSAEKPVGLVYIGIAYRDQIDAFEHHFSGSRQDVREQTVIQAFQHIKDVLGHP